jgi:hypothetical protein
MQVWPTTNQIDPEGWLDNFRKNEKPFALNLLANFLYYSDPLVDCLFLQAFLNLSRGLSRSPNAQADWKAFCDDATCTLVTGETPSPTDSGYTFARKARQVLGIAEERVLDTRAALERIVSGATRNVIFVDDFVGSGNQFVETWRRLYDVGAIKLNFARAAAKLPDVRFFYCAAIMGERGAAHIANVAPRVTLSAGHVLPSSYSWVDPTSSLWAPPFLSGGAEFIRQASLRAGIPDRLGATQDWRGYAGLGLGLAFEHSVPDATLPLFYWEGQGGGRHWHPLVKRR